MEDIKVTGGQDPKTAEGKKEPEKAFTQDELNAIVADRLGRERSKYSDYEDIKAKAAKFDESEENNKTEIQKATDKAEALQAKVDAMEKADSIRKVRSSVASEMGVPAELLTGADEETCKSQAEAIKNFAKTATYPDVPNGTGGTPTLSKEDILKIPNERERVKAIEENIELFKK